MSSSRTVKTLAALVAAMTLGAISLMVLETEPARPTAQPLAVVAPPPAGAGKVVYETRIPIQPAKWRNMVIHSSLGPASQIARECHFLVDRGPDGHWQVVPTENWDNQRETRHIGGIWRDSSIGICLIGDFAQQQPPRAQMSALVELVHVLQDVCRVSADRVYLYSDLVARTSSPGAAFPASAFSAELLRPGR